MTESATTVGPVTLDDVRAALGDLDPSATNSGALRRVLGRGSFTTIQKHLDLIRQELAAPALEALGAAPEVPRELVQALWSAAWMAAQARTAGALAQAQAQAAQQTAALAVARADAEAAQVEVDQMGQALAAAQALVAQQADQAAQELAVQQHAAQELAAQQVLELATLRQDLAIVKQAQALELARSQAVEATLRGELDRQISQLADLRAALGSKG